MTTALVNELVFDALPAGTSLLGDQFTILRRIGNGGFGITYQARDNYLDRKVVIKECFPHAICSRQKTEVRTRREGDNEKFYRITRMFVREARRIAKMQHPNIIGVQRIFEQNSTAYIVLDLVDGPTLLDIIHGESATDLSPSDVGALLHTLLDAVQEVHEHDFLHRDISPDNILIDRWGAPVLIDFGAAREQASHESRELSTLLVVKDGYSPQEFYFAGGKQSNSSDLYALAATFYHLISGEVPPNSQLRAADLASDCTDPCVPLTGRFNEYDPALLKSIDKAMQVLPRDRLQSTHIWKAMIKRDIEIPTRNPSPLVENALTKTISRVVSETNKDITAVSAVPKSPASDPMQVQRSVTFEWTQEFNAETTRPVDMDWAARLNRASSGPACSRVDAKCRKSRSRSLNAIHYLALCLFISAAFIWYIWK